MDALLHESYHLGEEEGEKEEEEEEQQEKGFL